MKNDSNNLTIEHIQKSVQHIEENEKNLIKSTVYDVIINGKPYPPKEVLRCSIELFGQPADWSGSGGQPTNKYFKQLGFEVRNKRDNRDVNQEIINSYKRQLAIHGLEHELYKWQLLNHWQNKPDLEVADFTEEIKNLDHSNLLYHSARSVMHHIVSERPENYRAGLRLLFDETIPLPQRIVEFKDLILKTYREIHDVKEHSHHHDERTIACLLAFRDSSKYMLYKNSFYKKYCDLLGIKKAKTNEKYIHYLELAEEFKEKYVRPDTELIQSVRNLLPDDAYPDENLNILTQDILYQVLEGKFSETADDGIKIKSTNTLTNKKPQLNRILYGPPGTGKTYNAINEAIKIIDRNFNLTQERSIIKREFDRLQAEGRIVFTTFHQSMNYEDFVEGIKPISPEEDNEKGQVAYEVQSGIFKNICNQARVVKGKKVDIDFTKVNFHKMSLGGKNRPDIHEWCISNNKLALGYGGEHDLSEFRKVTDWVNFRELFKQKYPELVASTRFNTQAAYAFIHMKPDDIVVISKGNHIIDAIGRVKNEYHYENSNSIDYFHFRDVEWLATDMGASPEKFVKKNISQVTIYTFNNSDMKLDAYRELTGNKSEEEKNYVLIIDEINRGNVSQIFGELITLIEPDKRQGKAEALELTLPYSKTKFGVPPNLYIIGTMNTADRSVEALDAALRRRFHFTEMPPDAAIIRRKEVDQIGDFNTADILETINNRIRILLDHDHLIGHSYFLKVKNIEDLRHAFVDRIIPLLQEYFYGDYSKIALVLGKGFCDIDEQLSKNDFAPGLNDFSDNYADRQIFILKRIETTDEFTTALEQMGIRKNNADA